MPVPDGFVSVEDQLTNIAQIIRGAPRATLRRAFVRSLREFCQQTMYLRENVAGLTVNGTRQYALGDDPYQDIVAILALAATRSDGSVAALAPTDPTMWNPNQVNAFPCRYTYVPQAQFALDPIPDGAYNLTITIVTQPKEAAQNVPVAPLIKYSNEVEAGALAYLHTIPDMPWTSPTQAELRRREFQAGINNGKIEVQRSFNTGSMRIRPRAFVTCRRWI